MNPNPCPKPTEIAFFLTYKTLTEMIELHARTCINCAFALMEIELAQRDDSGNESLEFHVRPPQQPDTLELARDEANYLARHAATQFRFRSLNEPIPLKLDPERAGSLTRNTAAQHRRAWKSA